MKGMVGDSSFEHKQGELLERLQKTVKQERLAVGYPKRVSRVTYTEQVPRLVLFLLKTGMAANLISKATGLSLSYVMNTEKKYKENPQPAMIVRELTIAPSNENTSALSETQITVGQPATVTVMLPNQIQLTLTESMLNSEFLKILFQLSVQSSKEVA